MTLWKLVFSTPTSEWKHWKHVDMRPLLSSQKWQFPLLLHCRFGNPKLLLHPSYHLLSSVLQMTQKCQLKQLDANAPSYMIRRIPTRRMSSKPFWIYPYSTLLIVPNNTRHLACNGKTSPEWSMRRRYYTKYSLYPVHSPDGHPSFETSRSLHGVACPSERHSPLRSSRHRKNNASESRSDRVQRALLQHLIVLSHKQMGRRVRKDRASTLQVNKSPTKNNRVAYKNQPAIIFIDEIDSILTSRSFFHSIELIVAKTKMKRVDGWKPNFSSN